jgi:hypothetical protein
MNSLVFAGLIAPDDGGVVEASDSPVDTAASSRIYSFSLKRSLALEIKDNTSRKKGGKAAVSNGSVDRSEPEKSGGAVSKKGNGRRHESKKGDLDPPILEVETEIGSKVVTRNRLKNSEI